MPGCGEKIVLEGLEVLHFIGFGFCVVCGRCPRVLFGAQVSHPASLIIVIVIIIVVRKINFSGYHTIIPSSGPVRVKFGRRMVYLNVFVMGLELLVIMAAVVTVSAAGASRGTDDVRAHHQQNDVGATGPSSTSHQLTFKNALVRQMWQTPIQQFSLLNSGILSQDLDRLAQELIAYYKQFVANDVKNSSFSAADRSISSVSDRFYRSQRDADLRYKQCLMTAPKSKSCVSDRPTLFEDLSRIFLMSLRYMEQEFFTTIIDDSAVVPDAQLLRVFAWTSLHRAGSHHVSHHHVDSAVSGVFYVQVPSASSSPAEVEAGGGSGDLIFYDPRGSLPPFGKSLHIRPVVGDLVLFPGYLMHSVAPTYSMEGYRISVSFNFQGSWETLSDVNSGYHS
jgi:hypothetical protein